MQDANRKNIFERIHSRFKEFLEGFKEGYNTKTVGDVYSNEDGEIYSKIGEKVYNYNPLDDTWSRDHTLRENNRRLHESRNTPIR